MPTAPLGTFPYTVKPRDTLSKIAQRYNTTVSNILAFNSIPDPDIISVGQKIVIPESPPEAIIYTVQPNDTLYSIAQEYGTQIDTIIEFNYISNPDLIKPGQKLVVPVSLR
ncbi:LysM peptidoglycan-binding domain-containing protein [Sporohalobacter salinus]|uniref:LysM peptidoglycan-binding domain-containing protein n=1 Tax=Sporohalobacter salinus TaxID=1494606 RepID=UPI00196218FF|nr:LysM domain-containing protein [Sporohalobacter salinus]MBM7622821.1 LysM repeat protein [Sporohalobacter salinus]